MTRGVAARREGDRYQDVYGWFRALELLRPAGKVARVVVEDPTAGRFDDVTLYPAANTSHRPEFVQVKFHVNAAGVYSAEALVSGQRRNGRTLLQKAWESWRLLSQSHDEPGLLLVSTWPWDPRDPLAPHIRYGDRLTRALVDGEIDGRAGDARRAWWEHLERPEETEFRAFLRSLRFRLGYDATGELLERTKERMAALGLKDDDEAVAKGHEWIWRRIADGDGVITADDVKSVIERHGLQDVQAEPSVSLYLHTILKEPVEAEGDYELDWRDYFEGDEWLRGHRIRDERLWNEVMLPELRATRERIAADTPCRLLLARGKARLSAWFALGAVFPAVGGWTLEVDQNGQRWRTDANPSEDLDLVERLESRGGDAETLAVGISITGDLSGDVRRYLEQTGEPAGSLLLIEPNRPLAPTAIRSAGDLTKLAQLIRARIRAALGHRPRRVLLFYFGPLSGAAFIGHQLNAVAGEVQIFEDLSLGYGPSFLLR